ncbi:putative ABC transporter permease [Ferdinandcohnia quinoae]|uniref:ABC transporter permease n=1 Tax=Fredinandcohnia quinoae TaxID=2918902 RepID=A0AAW5EAI4_9BACI|nr:putative ABC transporter permease [Fredinandcohnia sp. SECRCQ15]MCH1626887.1 putative ABC transporter permease [Fredinandcohnia sp. SECRCQ15]
MHTSFVLVSVETFREVIFYFIIYSFIGWLLENIYSFATTKKFFKPNFFLGPFKPMYGFAPVILVYLINQNMHLTTVIFLCFFIPTLVEYVSGLLLLKFFQRKWWDYSNLPLQLHGHICLPFSICWIFLSLLCVKIVHPGMISMYERIDQYWLLVWPTVALYFLAEMILAIRRHSTKELSDVKQTNQINK